MNSKNPAAVALGSIKTSKKAKAARRNGKKGGRPQATATLTIHGAGEMTQQGRWEVVEWLRQQAEELRDLGAIYAPRFTARYMARHAKLRNKM